MDSMRGVWKLMSENIVLCGYLGVCSCYDCRYKRIPVWILAAGLMTGLLFACRTLAGGADLRGIIAGFAPGTLLALYAYVTEGKLGKADGVMVLTIGMLKSWRYCIAAVMGACMLAALYSVLLLFLRKADRGTKIPFAPFLLAGAAVLCLGRF